jgi:hypothetical protein
MRSFILSLFLFAFSVPSFSEIVTLPIPGAPGLNMTVGTGVNALPLQEIKNNPNAVNITTWDDHYTNVPLGFTFPFFGQNFTESWAATNGYVTFQNPETSGLYGGCCSGVDLSRTTDPRYNYSIYAMHTDLYSWNGENQYYLRENNSMTYGWYGVSQCCSSQGGNSFEIKIDSTGLIDTRIAGAMVSYNAVTSGIAGNLANGEYFQYYHGSGLNITPGSANIFSWNTNGGTGQGVDQCTLNPLYNQSCPGYAAAYLTQQCTINVLYNSSCPGYAQAYYTQQCTANPLYDINCPGYASAYLNYQCSANPLYSTTCEGYEQAYFTQQCTSNGLYSRECPNYAEAYAAQQALNQTSNSTISTSTTTTASPAIVSVISDPVVNSVVTTTTTSTSPATEATAIVPLVTMPEPVAATTTVASTTEEKTPASTEETSNATSTSVSENTTTTSISSASENKTEKPKTARQELQERRVAAARAKAVEDGKKLASTVGQATSLEQQTAVQNVVLSAMAFVPGFDVYGKTFIPDNVFYKPVEIYKKQSNVDNRRVLTGLVRGSELLHDEMINSQYKQNN